MNKSQNGWPASKNEKEIGIKIFKIKNTDRKIRLQKDAGVILAAFAAEFHAQVEPIDDPEIDDWGYAYRDVRGSDSVLSNHSSGTAIDLNATKHPLGAQNTFTKQQAVIIRELSKKYGIRWGGDYAKRKDEQHWEIVETPDEVKARIKAMKLKKEKKKWLRRKSSNPIKKKQLQ
ncbi:MAG: M15 family metallopeptidase [Thaumarchaeota archaeon]|nr:M15 family metallopeptidase [Nitrososphaerota archaeon]